MPRFGIGMRWWLALAFAFIAVVTAVGVAVVFSQRSEHALNERAQELAVGHSVAAAESVIRSIERDDLETALEVIAARRRLSLFVFSADGRLITPPESHGVELASIPLRRNALARALTGRRFIRSVAGGNGILVALPLRVDGAAAVVSYRARPDAAAEFAIVRAKVGEAALWASVVGAIVGFLVASLITIRLRWIAAATALIERGTFDRPLRPRFHDELGRLAEMIDRMRERLRDSFAIVESDRDRLRQLLERLQDGVVTFDRDLNLQFANEAARRLLAGAPAREGDVLPEPWPGFSLRRFVADLFEPDASVTEARVSPDDERTYVLIGIPAGEDSQTAIVVLADVTARERRERAEREFVSNAAHELRTPLAAIRGAVEMLKTGADDDAAERELFVGHIDRESARLERLVRALLVLARAQTRQELPAVSRVELRPLLEEVASTVCPQDGVEVDVVCPPHLAVVTEPNLAGQVIWNLAANAAKETQRGRITISADVLPDRAVAIEVSDTGNGVRPEDQERIFDRFYRGGSRDANGFGLGLAIVREAVRALSSEIEFRSAPGAGTTVRVVMPPRSEEAA